MSFLDDMPINQRRDICFIVGAVALSLAILAPALGLPGWLTTCLYLLSAGAAIPGIRYARETGMDFSVALVPWICIAAVGVASLGHFVWEFFLRY